MWETFASIASRLLDVAVIIAFAAAFIIGGRALKKRLAPIDAAALTLIRKLIGVARRPRD
jgi:hypothetical protein